MMANGVGGPQTVLFTVQHARTRFLSQNFLFFPLSIMLKQASFFPRIFLLHSLLFPWKWQRCGAIRLHDKKRFSSPFALFISRATCEEAEADGEFSGHSIHFSLKNECVAEKELWSFLFRHSSLGSGFPIIFFYPTTTKRLLYRRSSQSSSSSSASAAVRNGKNFGSVTCYSRRRQN